MLLYSWTLPTMKKSTQKFFSSCWRAEKLKSLRIFQQELLQIPAQIYWVRLKANDLNTAEMYPSFAKIAQSEGFPEIAATFLNIAVAERGHERRYLTLKKNLDEGATFKREGKVVWRCRNCGYMHEGNAAPDECPACKHEQAYFEVFGEVY